MIVVASVDYVGGSDADGGDADAMFDRKLSVEFDSYTMLGLVDVMNMQAMCLCVHCCSSV